MAGIAPLAGPAAVAPQQSAERAKMQQVATQFEAVFLRQMIGSMRTASIADGMFDSSASQQFRDMADSRTADSMAQSGAIGVADLLMKQYDAQHPAVAKSVTSPAVDSSG